METSYQKNESPTPAPNEVTKTRNMDDDLNSLTDLLKDFEYDGNQLKLQENQIQSNIQDNQEHGDYPMLANRGVSNPFIFEAAPPRQERPKKPKKTRTSVNNSPSIEEYSEPQPTSPRSPRSLLSPTSPLIGRSRSNSKTPKIPIGHTGIGLQKSSPSVTRRVQENIKKTSGGPRSRVSSYM